MKFNKDTLCLCFFRYRTGAQKMSLRGNPVRIGDGPAAVTGDDRSIKATDCNSWIGKALPVG
jgi:hypothetical protein